MPAARAGRPSRWQKPASLPAGWERGRRPGHELGNGLGANRSRLSFTSGGTWLGRMLAGGRQGGGCRGAQKKRQARSAGCQAGPSRFPPRHAQRRRALGTPWSTPRPRRSEACRRPARSASVVEPSAGLAAVAVGIHRTRRQCLFAYHAGPAGEGAGATLPPQPAKTGRVGDPGLPPELRSPLRD